MVAVATPATLQLTMSSIQVAVLAGSISLQMKATGLLDIQDLNLIVEKQKMVVPHFQILLELAMRQDIAEMDMLKLQDYHKNYGKTGSDINSSITGSIHRAAGEEVGLCRVDAGAW